MQKFSVIDVEDGIQHLKWVIWPPWPELKIRIFPTHTWFMNLVLPASSSSSVTAYLIHIASNVFKKLYIFVFNFYELWR
jgi:hypothetical protein